MTLRTGRRGQEGLGAPAEGSEVLAAGEETAAGGGSTASAGGRMALGSRGGETRSGSAMVAQLDETVPQAPGRRLAWLTNSGTVAVLTWLVVTPVASFIPSVLRHNPFSVVGAAVPLTVAACLSAVLFLVTRRWSGEIVAGAAAGLAAGWVVLMLRSALYGTPLGFSGVAGDAMRTSASVMHYTTTATPSDTIPGLVSEYPPFFTWTVGRTAALLGVEGWRLLADAEVLTTSAALLVAFLLWRRHVNSWVALAISGLTFVTWSDPRKAYEVITLAIVVPWVLETFGRPPRARMHWLVSGLLGGLMVVTYQAWVTYAALAILAIIVVTFRSETDRRAYVRRLVLVFAVAVVTSSWYVIPFAWAMLTQNGELVSDLYVTEGVNQNLFPFLDTTPLGVLQLVGLIGLVWFYRSVWWARPLLFLVVGVYVYRLISMVRFVLTKHSFFLHYTSRFYTVLLTIAGVLVLAHVGPLILRRARLTAPRAAAASVLALTMAWAGAQYTVKWMPQRDAEMFTGPRYAAGAHIDPLPDGSYSRYAPQDERRTWFPVGPIEQAVEKVKGPNPRLVTLTYDERLFAFVPWPGYVSIPIEGAGSLSRWHERRAEVTRLSQTTEPEAFAKASAATRFGPIDIFVLKSTPEGLAWDNLRFNRGQFAPEHWTVIDDLPENAVVAVRK